MKNDWIEKAVAVIHKDKVPYPYMDTLKEYADRKHIIYWEENDESTDLGKRICRS